ncbi:SMP-30/gluconolactonase/LRE family protein [Arthrospiribacter ruber]|uniref:Gluconolaconase n=1 Tax=Arthrospiribacter ruber TaxID=2487934 RepID=A0A951J1U9_9BACT|nr:SMP-30/gluconolactonase/LRE family protein [Arthrospiribacter ruber]MBW3470294.1 gluconolaconase [Arthrospiribacter ruber]
MKPSLKSVYLTFIAGTFFCFCQCNPPSENWVKKNETLIEKYGLEKRILDQDLNTDIYASLDAGQVVNLNSFENHELYPGVQAKFFWGTGAMVAILNLAPQAEIPGEAVLSDKFVFVLEGGVDFTADGNTLSMEALDREAPTGIHGGTPKLDFIYLEKDSKQAVQAGNKGAKLMEVYSPHRLDYLEKAGMDTNVDFSNTLTSRALPNIESNKVYDIYSIQLTKLASGAFSRLISGKNILLSFFYLDPDSSFENHIHPEEQIQITLRGSANELLLDEEHFMEENDLVRIPGNFVHGVSVGEKGFDGLDIFWPSRADYLARAKEQKELFESIIPEGSEPTLVIDGKSTQPELFFTEGPKWMNGKLYFSNMFFDEDFNADPEKSSIVEMDKDGNYRNITEGKMQANGLYPYKNGNLIVCDMMGHRVVEMTTSGQVVKVLADSYDGKPIDGPNDIVTDSKGGFYFTDPQFTMEEEKFQPGRAVYYVSPVGDISRVTEPNEFAMPNGILLSVDGKTLYINNTYDKESWYPVQSEKDNYIWAYDVNEDGSIQNGRQFAKVLLVGDVLERKGRSSGADGMAIDTEGNLYVATYYGVQIFNSAGQYIGMVNLPTFPISLSFGGEDMQTLYIVSFSNVYKIKTNKSGYINYAE